MAIRQLELLNETIPSDTKYFGVPYPGIFMVNADGVIKGKFAEEDYRKRPLMSDLLEAAGAMVAGQ